MQKILLGLAISILVAADLQAQSVEATLRYADEQYELHHYTNSVLAYERAIFFQDNTDVATYLKLANAYFNLTDYERAIRLYDIAFFAEQDQETKNEISFKKSLAYMAMADYNQALISLIGINTFQNPAAEKKKQFFKALVYYMKADYAQAENVLLQYVVQQNRVAAPAYQSFLQLNQKAEDIKPNLAMWMSVFVPGSGQILYGNWKDGINSMALSVALVGLYFNYAAQFTLIEGYVVVLPWFQRYHKGGYLRAKSYAEEKQDKLRSKAYFEMLKLHPQLLSAE